jgi:hypothetical protein
VVQVEVLVVKVLVVEQKQVILQHKEMMVEQLLQTQMMVQAVEELEQLVVME